MPTSTFDKKIELNDINSVKRLINVMNKDVSNIPLSKHPYTEQDRDRSERLLKRSLLKHKK